MATSKAKTVSKTKKTKEPVQAVKGKKIVNKKPLPGESEIREKAREVYMERTARGEHGTPESDWLKAEQLLKASKK